MNEEIVYEISNKATELRNQYDEDIITSKQFVEYKIKLYKAHMDYPEELSKALVSCGCFLLKITDDTCPDPFIACNQCKSTITHDILLKRINHVP